MVTILGTDADMAGGRRIGGAGSGGGGSSTSRSVATALLPLSVPTYDGKPGVGHPDVLHIPGGWNGYAYWMAFTPLPGTPRENPSVVASNDGITWEVPTGLTNPIVSYAQASALGYDYWADTDLVLSSDATTLMLYFKGTKTGISNEYLLTTSTDGTTWTAPQVVVPHAQNAGVSPSVVVEDDGSYVMFDIDNGQIVRRVSSNGIAWTGRTVGTRAAIDMPYEDDVWHVDVTRVGSTYHALVNAISPDATATPFRLFYMKSSDGLNWSAPSTAPAVPLTGGRYDARGHYRSTVQPAASGKAGLFDVWTACIDDTRASNHTSAVWRVGVIRDYDFTSGDVYAFPTPPPLSSLDHLTADSVMVMASHMQPHTGTPTRVIVPGTDTVAMALASGDQVALTLPHLPRGWHQFAVDVLVMNHTTTAGTVGIAGRFSFGMPGITAPAAGAKYADVNQVIDMPPAIGDTKWGLGLFTAAQSSIDLLREGFVTLRLDRYTGGLTTTYRDGSNNHLPLHIVAVRFRRAQT